MICVCVKWSISLRLKLSTMFHVVIYKRPTEFIGWIPYVRYFLSSENWKRSTEILTLHWQGTPLSLHSASVVSGCQSPRLLSASPETNTAINISPNISVTWKLFFYQGRSYKYQPIYMNGLKSFIAITIVRGPIRYHYKYVMTWKFYPHHGNRLKCQ